MVNPLEHITLIIPVHQRQYSLNRILRYYQGFKCRKIVADSSDTAWRSIKKFPEYEYNFVPGKLYYNKLRDVLNTVTTKFVVDVSDDDFTLKSAIIECVEFLSKNDEYSFAFGEVVRFSEQGAIHDSGFYGNFLKNEFVIHRNNNFSDSNVLNRIDNYFNHFLSPNHFVVKTEAALLHYNTILTHRELYPVAYGDTLFAFHLLFCGNYKALPLVYQLRSTDARLVGTEWFPAELGFGITFEDFIPTLKDIGDPLSRMIEKKYNIVSNKVSERLYSIINNYHSGKAKYATDFNGKLSSLPSYNLSTSAEWDKIVTLVRRYPLIKKTNIFKTMVGRIKGKIMMSVRAR